MSEVKMQAPATASGQFECRAPQQSGTVYRDVVPGSVIGVDTRDIPAFIGWGFVYAVGISVG
jgi:hypothetical protein